MRTPSAGPWRCQICDIVKEIIPADWELVSARQGVRIFRTSTQVHSLVSVNLGRNKRQLAVPSTEESKQQ
jgi:hypothetical protein